MTGIACMAVSPAVGSLSSLTVVLDDEPAIAVEEARVLDHHLDLVRARCRGALDGPKDARFARLPCVFQEIEAEDRRKAFRELFFHDVVEPVAIGVVLTLELLRSPWHERHQHRRAAQGAVLGSRLTRCSQHGNEGCCADEGYGYAEVPTASGAKLAGGGMCHF